MKKEEVVESLITDLKGSIPVARQNLSETEKDELIKKVGGLLTTKNIIAALRNFPPRRIPFLFSSIDTQALVDILANDMQAAMDRAEAAQKKT